MHKIKSLDLQEIYEHDSGRFGPKLQRFEKVKSNQYFWDYKYTLLRATLIGNTPPLS